MTNTTLVPIKLDAGVILDTVINGPHGNAVIFGCTICILAGIAGVCFLATEGCAVSLAAGNIRFQASESKENVL